MPVSKRRVGSTFQPERIVSRMRARLGVSGSSPVNAQVFPTDVGAARMAPRLRTSRSQLQRNSRPVPRRIVVFGYVEPISTVLSSIVVEAHGAHAVTGSAT